MERWFENPEFSVEYYFAFIIALILNLIAENLQMEA
jgi:hypothetical protein